jgi:DNA repair exonuclease SbcCD ATPase subunit
MCEHVKVHNLIERLEEEIDELNVERMCIERLEDEFPAIDRVGYNKGVSIIISKLEELVGWLKQQLKHIGELESELEDAQCARERQLMAELMTGGAV